jgi:hypothetical protein
VEPQWLIPFGLVTCATIHAIQNGLDVTASSFRAEMVNALIYSVASEGIGIEK